MSREYAIESSKLPLSIRGTLSQPAVRGVYLEELPDRVSDTSEISSDRYSVIEDDLMNVDGISDTSCPFTHSYAAYIYILESGTYRFYVRSNFGAEATIYDGERGVSTGVTCGAQAESSSVEEITFARRGYYKVEVKYYSTGEASPVLELHFGESSPDMASRSELPVFRDFYILETEYATLLGDGSVLRPGETCTIDLHNISEYYSIYGGSVTVWRADGVKTYPLEYDRVTIPMASILAGNVYPSSGCSARVTVLASSGGGCGCGCGCGEGGTSRTFTFDATVVPENYRENNDNQRVCACSNKTIEYFIKDEYDRNMVKYVHKNLRAATKMLLVLKGIHYRNVIKNNSKDGMILVTSWAKDQVTPDLQHGRWVMIGKATKLNYFAAGCPAGLFKHDNYITGYVEIERLKGVPYLYKTDKGWSADIPFLKHDLFNQWTLR